MTRSGGRTNNTVWTVPRDGTRSPVSSTPGQRNSIVCLRGLTVYYTVTRTVCGHIDYRCDDGWFSLPPSQNCQVSTPTFQNLNLERQIWISGITVKAPKFGPHGNFAPLFQKGLLSSKHILQKNEENKSCRKIWYLQIRFCLYLVQDSSKEATELAKKVQSFHEIQS